MIPASSVLNLSLFTNKIKENIFGNVIFVKSVHAFPRLFVQNSPICKGLHRNLVISV